MKIQDGKGLLCTLLASKTLFMSIRGTSRTVHPCFYTVYATVPGLNFCRSPPLVLRSMKGQEKSVSRDLNLRCPKCNSVLFLCATHEALSGDTFG